jgi:hypothetical protein
MGYLIAFVLGSWVGIGIMALMNVAKNRKD